MSPHQQDALAQVAGSLSERFARLADELGAGHPAGSTELGWIVSELDTVADLARGLAELAVFADCESPPTGE